MKLNKILSSFIIFAGLILGGCSEESEPMQAPTDGAETPETVKVVFDVTLGDSDPGATSRAGYSDELAAYESTFDCLVCQVFDTKGNLITVNPESEPTFGMAEDADEEGVLKFGTDPKQIKIENFKYRKDKISLSLIKGVEYTVCLWGMLGKDSDPLTPEGGDKYFKTFDEANGNSLKNIYVKCEDNVEDETVFYNNDFNREAFSFSYKIVQFDSESNQTFTLRRPFGQINFGILPEEFEKLGASLQGMKTGVHIDGIGNYYNVISSRGSSPFNIEDGVQVGHEAVFMTNDVPASLGEGYTLNIYDRDDQSVKTNYTWLSMSLILPLNSNKSDIGVASYSNVRLQFEYVTDEGTQTGELSFGNVPVLANYRTNVILTAEMIKGVSVQNHAFGLSSRSEGAFLTDYNYVIDRFR